MNRYEAYIEKAWGDALTRTELAPHWEVVRWWKDIIQPGNKDRIADAAEASVLALTRALRPGDSDSLPD